MRSARPVQAPGGPVDKLILYVNGPLPARTTGTITPPVGTKLTWTPPARRAISVPYYRALQPPFPFFTGLVGDTTDDRLLLLDGQAQQLLQLEWGGVCVPIPGPTPRVAGAKLSRIAATGSSRWLVADDAGRVTRSNGQGGWEEVGTVTGGLRTMTVAGEVVHGVDGNGRYGTIVGGSFQAGAVQPTGGIAGDAAIAVDSQGGVWISDIGGKRLLHLAAGASSWTDEALATAGAVTAPGALCVAKDGTLWVVNRGSETLVSRTTGGVWSVVPPEMGRFTGPDRKTLVPAVGMFVDSVGNAWTAASSYLQLVGPVSSDPPPNVLVLWRSSGEYAVMPTISMSSPWQAEVIAPFRLSSTTDPNAASVPVQLRFGFGMAPRPIAPPTCDPINLKTFPGMPVAYIPTGTADAGGPLSFVSSYTVAGTPNPLSSFGGAPIVWSDTTPEGAALWYTPAPFDTGSASTIQAVEGSLQSSPATVQVQIIPAPTVSATVSAGGAAVIPAPGPLGSASNQMLDTSQRSWRTRTWWGLQRPGDLAFDATTNDLWVLTPRDFRQALWRRRPTGETTAYGRAAGIVDLQEVAGVACVEGTVWVADGARPLVWMRDPTSGVWSSMTVAGDRVPGGIAAIELLVFLTIPADGTIVMGFNNFSRQSVVAPPFSGPGPDHGPSGTGMPKSPQAIAIEPRRGPAIWVTNKDDGKLYRWNGQWRSFDPALSSIGGGTPLSGLAIDDQLRVWTTEPARQRVLCLTLVGDTPQWSVGPTVGGATGSVLGQTHIDVGRNGRIWMSDPGNDRILQYGSFLTTAGFDVEVRSDGSLICENTNGRLGTDTLQVSAISSVPGASNPSVAPTPLTVQLTSR